MRRVAALVATTLAVAGCGSHAGTPAAPIARGVPYGYRATKVWHAELTGSGVDDVIVASSGPPITSLAFRSADVRVLSWDSVARDWYVSFDAQKVVPLPFGGIDDNSPPVLYSGNRTAKPLLDPKAGVRLEPVTFARLMPARRQQLVLGAAMSYGGSGVPTVVAVVDFAGGFGQTVYEWNGDRGGGYVVAGNRLRVRGVYWTDTDAHCCAVRTYGFTVGWQGGQLREVADDRPWLGAVVRAPNDAVGLFGHDRVQMVMAGSPAFGNLQVGDVLLRVSNAHAPAWVKQNGHASILDQVSSLHAGETADIVIRRGGKTMTVDVPLGSLKDAQRYELADSEVLEVSAL